ncbi:MAG: S41 family peptidase [Chloroflexi bacterium]|nr:S41 family peptidase [Chloroflexota bacterium]
MWKAAKWGLLGLVIVLATVLAGAVGFTLGQEEGGGVATRDRPAGGFGILDEIYGVLQQDFVDPERIDPNILRLGAINGIIQALGDPHTIYIDPETYSLGIDIISGTFEGIGAQVDQDSLTGDIVIVTPFRDSPAEKAGILPGDVILAVDGESTEGWTVSQAVQRIRGPDGSEVVLTVRHQGGKTKDVTVVRDTIVIPTVFTRELEDADGNPVPEIAYIELQQFTDQTVPELSKALKDIEDAGYKGLILDLRRNPGGGLDATVQVADMFLDDGVILTQVDRDGGETVFEARPGGEALKIPTVILVGPGSASGSEVLAGALRDNDRAVLIGQRTFGKATVNHLRELSDGGALYVSIARWLTPDGEQIEGVGLKPDRLVKLTQKDLALRRDSQLLAAINYLKRQFTQAAP